MDQLLETNCFYIETSKSVGFGRIAANDEHQHVISKLFEVVLLFDKT